MCGLTGLWSDPPLPEPDARALVTRMRDTMVARGPDDAGLWGDAAAGLWLGHRRLSIQDLSLEGHQPMISASRRYAIAYNGEVYNFGELRSDLETQGRAPAWRGGSDTEVVLAAIEAWGLEAALTRFVGMFAIALWDSAERQLHLVRDRFGIKPLCYGRAGRALVFGSTLATLRAHPELDVSIDREVLATYLRFSCVPAPYTIHPNAWKVRPGTYVTFRAADDAGVETAWWCAETSLRKAVSDPLDGSDEELADALERALSDAVRARLLADVPVGAFLSGGVDSSTVVALMQNLGDRRVRTFTIGNEGSDYDESAAAAAVAAHLGTDHTELLVTAADAMEVIPLLPEMFDEPFSDPSELPTYLVSKLARESVTVALSGDGGDELFAGYNRHSWVPKIWRMVGGIPPVLRQVFARGIRVLSPNQWDRIYAQGARWVPSVRLPGEKLHKLAGVISSRSAQELYLGVQSHWMSPHRVVLGTQREAPRAEARSPLADITHHMMFQDLVGYLPDDILAKVDRASMAVSLEARVPILDHRVVELAWRMPLSGKVRNGVGKRVLRSVLARHVPRRLWDRPKMGFGVPVGAWIRGPLRDWAEELIRPSRLEQDGLLDPESIQERWRAHLTGRADHQHELWDVLMFQAWTASLPRMPRPTLGAHEVAGA